MELQLSPLPILFTFLLLFMVKKIREKNKNPAPKLPPGPWKLPIIGNIHQLIGPLPHHALRDLANKHGPFMHLRLGEVSMIIVSSPRFAEEVMKNHDLNFADRPFFLPSKIISYGCTNIAFSPYCNYWRQLRKICTLELLSTRRVESFSHIREEEVVNLVRSIFAAANSPINLTEKLFALTNNVISKAMLGKKCKEQEKFNSGLKEAIELSGGFTLADLFPSLEFISVISGMRYKLEKVAKKLDGFMEEIIKERRQMRLAKEMRRSEGEEEEEEDLIDVLLRIQQHGVLDFPLTSDNIKAVILDLFFGGTETSSTLMDWVMAELMRNPRVREKVQTEVRMAFKEKGKLEEREIGELSYLKSVVKETLRLHPPLALLLPRQCREKCEIAGYEIPPKTRVIINGWAIGRDPEHWDDPETFKPERFDGSPIDFKGNNFEFIPFGAGRRMCPGISFGVVNSLLPLAQLLYYFDWKLPSEMKPEDLDMMETFGATVSRRSDLHLVPIPCFPLPIEQDN
ncbi:Cytochrome P450 [Cinnamomum micranthum f. kanehirae]|uniref:Cytochrome P450 n=1 Tax=Cinnamomum micranthum f. kanehirae TaxID=337451 RepID=A0A443N2T5_9MAGN|nr:Cytochrome P450 [Cinnamomum micranthum f. kanehirae]